MGNKTGFVRPGHKCVNIDGLQSQVTNADLIHTLFTVCKAVFSKQNSATLVCYIWSLYLMIKWPISNNANDKVIKYITVINMSEEINACKWLMTVKLNKKNSDHL